MLLFCTFTLAIPADYLNGRGADLRVAAGVGRVVWYRVLSDDLSDPVVWAIEWVEWVELGARGQRVARCG